MPPRTARRGGRAARPAAAQTTSAYHLGSPARPPYLSLILCSAIASASNEPLRDSRHSLFSLFSEVAKEGALLMRMDAPTPDGCATPAHPPLLSRTRLERALAVHEGTARELAAAPPALLGREALGDREGGVSHGAAAAARGPRESGARARVPQFRPAAAAIASTTTRGSEEEARPRRARHRG